MVDIRLAITQDLPQLVNLVRREAECQRKLAPNFRLKPQANWAQYVSSKLQRRDTAIIVAEQSGDLMGYVEARVVHQGQRVPVDGLKGVVRRLVQPFRREPESMIEPRRFGFIEDIYVAPAVRNQGIATQLSQCSFQWLQSQQVDEIEATIAMANEASLRFFQKLGLEPIRVMVWKRPETGAR